MRYPAHITDPIRLTVAKTLLVTELEKLMTMAESHLKSTTLRRLLETNVGQWTLDTPEFPIRDFWNGWHGIMMGFRLVPSLAWLTSLDVEWSYQESYPVNEMEFGTILPQLRPMNRKPTAVEARDWLGAPAQREHLAAIRREIEIRTVAVGINKPIPPVILQQREGLAALADGNNRLLRTLVLGETTMPAYLGRAVTEPTDRPFLTEAWIPTSVLMELIFQYRLHEHSSGSKEAIARTLALLVRYSTAGRYELVERAVNCRDARDTELLQVTIDELPTELRRDLQVVQTAKLREIGVT